MVFLLLIPNFSLPAFAEDSDGMINISSDWQGSIMGNLGGTPNSDNFGITENGDGTVTLKSINDKGKVESVSEGIAYYYKDVPADADYTLSATAHVDTWTANGQVGFGLMLRSNVLENENDGSFTGDYVALGAIDQQMKGFYKYEESTVQKNDYTFPSTVPAPAEGQEYDLEITKSGNMFMLSINGEIKVMEEYTGELNYAGLFTSRNTEVTFRNVSLEMEEPVEVPADWAFSAFGSNTSISERNPDPTVHEDGSVTINAQGGKISSTVDGISYYFKQLPSDVNFEITTTAKVHSFNADNQVSFGLMLRDEVGVHGDSSGHESKFVAVGALDQVMKAFYDNGSLSKVNEFGSISGPAPGEIYDLSIKKSGSQYVVAINDVETTIEADALFTDEVFAGIYTARGTEVTFSDFDIEIDTSLVTGLQVDSSNMKTIYNVGESLDVSGLKVTALFKNGEEQVLSEGDYDVTGFDSSTAGQNQMTITYLGKSAKVNLVIENADTPPPATEPGEGSSEGIYEAEEAEYSNGKVDNKHAGFTGTGFVDTDNAPGEWIEWKVNVPADGEYNLDFRYAHGGADQRPAQISVNGEVVVEELAFDASGTWTNWVNASTKAQLTAGENTIRATATAAGGLTNMDHLRVYFEFDEIFEAEDAERDEAGVIIDNKHPGFTGTGFIDYSPNQPGSWVKWTVHVPVDGEYNLDFRYAHGGTDARPAEIKVNGEVVEEELAFDPSGGWATWVYTSTKAQLTAGENVIIATGVGASGGANIDHLRIHNKSDTTDGGQIDIEDSDLSEVVSGFYLKKLKEVGILVDELPADDEPMTRIEFMSFINDAFGFVYEEKYKGLSGKTNVWEVSLDEWYSYVLEAAEEAGYMDGLLVNGQINPNQEITKQEAEQILANVQGTTASSKDKQVLTWGEAKALVDPLRTENMNEDVSIVGVHAVTNNLVAVTLNSTYEEFDFSDIEVVIPTRDWSLLSPGFKKLAVDKGAVGTNKFGQTVLMLHSQDEWDEHASIKTEIKEVRFSGNLDTAITEANNLLTWQMDHGGWTKNWPYIYTREWNGTESKSEWVANGVELGTIDNDATISEMLYLAQVYQETQDDRYKESIEKGFDFLFDLQYDSGGFAQVYPRRGNYSDYVTFNDEAMINVMEVLDLALERKYPFDSDLISDEYFAKIRESKELAIDYILKSQIEADGVLTAWGQQHDPVTYEPKEARSYEHPSISGSESVGIIRYLMSQPQTEEIRQSALAALEWLDEVKLENTRYASGDPNNIYFYEDSNSTAWYRFYEIGTNKGIFSGRDGVIKYNILEIEEERRNGYSWGGHWGTQLLAIAEQTGNYMDKVFVRVANTNSTDIYERTLVDGSVKQVEPQQEQLGDIDYMLTVAKDGSGDYHTVQAAIDAVPANNSIPVTIYVKDGTYKEVVEVPANKPFITLIGESQEGTVITYDNYAGRDNGVGGTLGTSGSASVYLRANDFRAENLTFENSFDESMDVNGKQAVAVYASGSRQYFKNVSFIGNQDTLYTHSGTQYYYQVYVEGDVDFIFGGASAVFEEAVIHSLDRGSDSNNGYITAASTLLSEKYGMLILNSTLTSDAAPNTVYLGRPWPAGGNPEARGSVVYMNTMMGDHIKTEGWTSMSGLDPMDARLYEYKNEGPGAVVNEHRRQLTDEEAAEWTVVNVLKGWDPSQVTPIELPEESKKDKDKKKDKYKKKEKDKDKN